MTNETKRRALVHFAAIDEEGYLQHWSQDLVTEDLAGSIARLLAWHREDGLAKGDARVVVCTGWHHQPVRQPGLFEGAA